MAAAVRRLSWTSLPFSTCERWRFGCAGNHARTVPPSGFGYPHDGLHPPAPGRSCFVPAALMGFTLRSFLLHRGCRPVSKPVEPTCRFFARHLPTPKRGAGPSDRGSWVSTPGRVPREAPDGYAGPRRMLPWVFPFQGFPCADLLQREHLRSPLTRLATGTPESDPGPHLRVSIDRRLTAAVDRAEARAVAAAFLGFPHLANPCHSGSGRAGYVFTERRVVRYRRLPPLFA